MSKNPVFPFQSRFTVCRMCRRWRELNTFGSSCYAASVVYLHNMTPVAYNSCLCVKNNKHMHIVQTWFYYLFECNCTVETKICSLCTHYSNWGRNCDAKLSQHLTSTWLDSNLLLFSFLGKWHETHFSPVNLRDRIMQLGDFCFQCNSFDTTMRALCRILRSWNLL